MPVAYQAVVAHATSLFVIVPTATAGIVAYRRSGLVRWRVALPMAAGAVVAAVVGARLAVLLPPQVLKASFGAFLMASGANLLRRHRARLPEVRERDGIPVLLAAGTLVGVITALLGVGGGIVAIPLLLYLVRMDIREVAATSLGVVVFSALTAAVTYGVTGWGHPDLPAANLGYIYTPAGLALLPGAVLSARVGARLNQRMDPRGLRILFGALFVLVGLRLLAVNLRDLL